MRHACAMPPKKRKKLSRAELDAEHAALVDLRAKVPFISQSALAAMLSLSQAGALPNVGTRAMVRAARDKFVSRPTPYGKIHQVLSHPSGLEFEVQSPFAMLWELCRCSAAITGLVKALRPSSPSQPLSLVFYCDEVAPGNQLSYKNLRKTWACYYSVFEWGVAALSNEDCAAYTHYVYIYLPPSWLTSYRYTMDMS